MTIGMKALSSLACAHGWTIIVDCSPPIYEGTAALVLTVLHWLIHHQASHHLVSAFYASRSVLYHRFSSTACLVVPLQCQSNCLSNPMWRPTPQLGEGIWHFVSSNAWLVWTNFPSSFFWNIIFLSCDTENRDHVERTDHGEHATPRRVVTPGPNIASVDLVRSLHMIRKQLPCPYFKSTDSWRRSLSGFLCSPRQTKAVISCDMI